MGLKELLAMKNAAELAETAAQVQGIEDNYILSEKYENLIGAIDTLTLWDNAGNASLADGYLTGTPTQTWGEFGVKFFNADNYIGKTLLFTCKVTPVAGGNLSPRLWKYNGGTQIGSSAGAVVLTVAGVEGRIGHTITIESGYDRIFFGVSESIAPLDTYSLRDFMVIDVTEEPGFDPDALPNCGGYWIGNPPATQVKILYETIKENIWDGKNVLVIGDSLTAANVWQQKLNTVLGMNVTTHALGGIGLVTMVDGNGSIDALDTDDVTGKDLIIVFGGYNDRAKLKGSIGDLYPTDNTFAGILQYVINSIYALLETAGNLTCKVAVVTPHCVGKYSYIEYDGYAEYPLSSGQTLQDVCDMMESVAEYNSLPCYNAWRESGINKFTWSVYSASATQTAEPPSNDQLHLNTATGYPHLGERIAAFVTNI